MNAFFQKKKVYFLIQKGIVIYGLRRIAIELIRTSVRKYEHV